MRVLLATDGSAAADEARDLVAGLPWPGGSAIDVLHVVQPPIVAMANLGQVLGPSEGTDLVGAMEGEGRVILAATAARIAGPGRHVHTRLVVGRPAEVIAEMARERQVDLVVTGHRGRSGLGRLLLGSVAAEVVDRSPAPVLVARGARATDVLLAVDGSPVTEAAVRFVERSPVLHASHVRVLSVADPSYPWWAGVDWMADAAADAWSDALDTSRSSHAQLARETTERLRAVGIDAHAVSGEGRVADVILEQADAQPTDLIVVGSRGQTGLRRMLVGSVGRDVLHHAHCSVLIARDHPVRDAA
jgi:nucleotide-binding universal stress UspA family protein